MNTKKEIFINSSWRRFQEMMFCHCFISSTEYCDTDATQSVMLCNICSVLFYFGMFVLSVFLWFSSLVTSCPVSFVMTCHAPDCLHLSLIGSIPILCLSPSHLTLWVFVSSQCSDSVSLLNLGDFDCSDFVCLLTLCLCSLQRPVFSLLYAVFDLHLGVH